MTSTHAIDSDLMDRIISKLNYLSGSRVASPNLSKEIRGIIDELNHEREWFVISVLHPGRLVEKADNPLAKLAWENVSEIANNVANNQGYDDELDLAIQEEWDKFLADHEEAERTVKEISGE